MQLIVSDTYSPSFNLAAEQYLLAERQSDVLLFYINSPCIVIGRNQNAFAEINIPLCRQENITVVRRLSGGGAVYHDEGNLNFCFISQKSNSPLDIDYLAIIEDALSHLSINTTRGTRKDLYSNNKKISGTALHSTGDHLLFHGTLLYNANLDRLEKALTPSEKSESRAVKSIRSVVGNILSQNLSSPLEKSGEVFLQQLLPYFSIKYRTTPIHFSSEDKTAIQQLQAERYDTWEWNWAQSPKSQLTRSFEFEGQTYDLLLTIEKGLITSISNNCPDKLQRQLAGSRFEG
jgi:lipoate-protein ligase A